MKILLIIAALIFALPSGAGVAAVVGQGQSVSYRARLYPDNIYVGLSAHWKLEETGSGQRSDSVGLNHLGANTSIGNAAGKIGNAVDLSGSSQYLAKTSSPFNFGNTSFTIAGWVFFDVLSSGIPVISQEGNFTKEYQLATDGTVLQFSVSTNGSTFQTTVSSTVVLSTGTWYFWRIWHDAGTDQIGIQVNAETEVTAAHATGTYLDGTSSSFLLGFRNDTVQYLNGRIDSVSVWARHLPSAYQADLYSVLDYPFPIISH